MTLIILAGSFSSRAQESGDRPNAGKGSAPRPEGDAGHGHMTLYTERGRYTAGYSDDAPKPPAEWVQAVKNDEPAQSLLEKRILPIFNPPQASSCTECLHGGVELKDYIFPSQEKTFAALLKGKMVDMENPESSKILEFIIRRPEKTSLVNDSVRHEEYAAFRSWIHAAVKDPRLLSAKADGQASGPSWPTEVIRHARTDQVLARSWKMPGARRRYLAKIYIDDGGHLEKDPKAELGDAEFMGEVAFRSEWKPNPQNVTVIAYPPSLGGRHRLKGLSTKMPRAGPEFLGFSR